MATLELMSKTPQNGTPPHRTTQTERRGTRRCKITQLMRIRPSDPETKYFEDLRRTMSASRSGIYFQTTELDYEVGQRLFVTMPYSTDPCTIGREYLAEVVRKDALKNGMTGIGFKTLTEIAEQPSYSFHAPGQQK